MNLIEINHYNLGHWGVAFVAVLVLVLGVGRLVRVIVHDEFPPAMWWREKWGELTNHGDWEKLFTCHWCLPFWIVIPALIWFGVGLWVPWVALAWWLFWGALALSYIVSMVIERDDR